MINIQPMLDEAKQSRGNPKFTELRKLFREHGDAAAEAIKVHWRNVEMGLTDEYKQKVEL